MPANAFIILARIAQTFTCVKLNFVCLKQNTFNAVCYTYVI